MGKTGKCGRRWGGGKEVKMGIMGDNGENGKKMGEMGETIITLVIAHAKSSKAYNTALW